MTTALWKNQCRVLGHEMKTDGVMKREKNWAYDKGKKGTWDRRMFTKYEQVFQASTAAYS